MFHTALLYICIFFYAMVSNVILTCLGEISICSLMHQFHNDCISDVKREKDDNILPGVG